MIKTKRYTTIPKVQRSIRFPEELLKKIDKEAEKKSVSSSTIVIDILLSKYGMKD